MKPNIGSTDRIIRIILGAIIAALGIIFQSWWGLIGLVLLFTAFVRWCPAYLPFGISTFGRKDKEATSI
jgi:type IV secretory pathway TrbD component